MLCTNASLAHRLWWSFKPWSNGAWQSMIVWEPKITLTIISCHSHPQTVWSQLSHATVYQLSLYVLGVAKWKCQQQNVAELHKMDFPHRKKAAACFAFVESSWPPWFNFVCLNETACQILGKQLNEIHYHKLNRIIPVVKRWKLSSTIMIKVNDRWW